MFSRAEREYLGVLAQSQREGTDPTRALARLFPNPVYRRKILWGIRRKAQRTAADLSLYAIAARAESRVLPRPPSAGTSTVPLTEDPLLTFLRYLASGLGSRPTPKTGSGSPTGSRDERKVQR